MNPLAPEPFDCLGSQFLWLNAVNSRLNCWIVVLNTQGSSITSDRAQRFDVLKRQTPRIDFHAELRIVSDVEAAANHFSESPKFFGQKKGRSATSKMDLHHIPARIDQQSDSVHFFREQIEVSSAFA